LTFVIARNREAVSRNRFASPTDLFDNTQRIIPGHRARCPGHDANARSSVIARSTREWTRLDSWVNYPNS
jgi:hypothetical protein